VLLFHAPSPQADQGTRPLATLEWWRTRLGSSTSEIRRQLRRAGRV